MTQISPAEKLSIVKEVLGDIKPTFAWYRAGNIETIAEAEAAKIFEETQTPREHGNLELHSPYMNGSVVTPNLQPRTDEDFNAVRVRRPLKIVPTVHVKGLEAGLFRVSGKNESSQYFTVDFLEKEIEAPPHMRAYAEREGFKFRDSTAA